MNQALALPLILPLLAAILCTLGRRSTTFQRVVSIVASAATLFTGILLLGTVRHGDYLVLAIGNWTAPYGIVLVADVLSSVMIIMSGLLGMLASIYGQATLDATRERHYYHVFFQGLLLGVNGAFLTGDLFNMYVWFEVMLMSSFVLLSLGGERPQLEGALKYVAMNFLASALFLAAVGILYGMTGTLNMADLALRVQSSEDAGLLSATAMLFLVAFGIKAAIFPLFFWLPASYHTPPAPVIAIFAGLLTKVGVYALIRVFTLIFPLHDPFMRDLVVGLAAFTMVTGVLGAAAQMDVRRLLAFHIVSQIGYMILGLGIFTKGALAAAMFYMVHNMIAKTNLFLIAGAVARKTGLNDLKKLGGLAKTNPLLGMLFLISAMGLAGLPPLSGFFGKLALAIGGFEADRFIVTGIALGVGLLTLFSMTKIWNEAYWKPRPGAPEGGSSPLVWTRHERICLLGPIIILATGTVLLGFGAGWAFELATTAAEQLIHPENYIRAVLTGGATP